MINPDDSLSDPNPIKRVRNRAKTKLSIYSKQLRSWAFLDPASITWESYNSVDYFVVTDQQIAILSEDQDDPSIFNDYLTENKVLYKIVVGDTTEFRSASDLRLFKQLFVEEPSE